MTFATIINVVFSALCVIVVIQSMRMMKGVRELRDVSLDQSVKQMDAATARAQAVLTELKMVLGSAASTHSRTVAEGEALRDELSVMIGIGNSVADRIVEVAAAQNGPKAVNDDDANMPVMAKPAPAQASSERRENGRHGNRRSGQRSGANRNASSEIVETVIKAVKSTRVGHA